MVEVAAEPAARRAHPGRAAVLPAKPVKPARRLAKAG